MGKVATFSTLFLIGLGILSIMLSSLPQTQASPGVLEKFPTSTSVIVVGWLNPTNAYADDGAATQSNSFGANQQYGGFGFNFNGSETIESVYVTVDHFAESVFGELCNEIFEVQYGYESNGTMVSSFLVFDYYLDYLSFFYFDSWIEASFDVTAVVGQNHAWLNDFAVRIINFGEFDGLILNVDYISVEVAYTTTTEGNMEQYMFLGFVIALIPIAVVFFYPRSQKQLEETQS